MYAVYKDFIAPPINWKDQKELIKFFKDIQFVQENHEDNFKKISEIPLWVLANKPLLSEVIETNCHIIPYLPYFRLHFEDLVDKESIPNAVSRWNINTISYSDSFYKVIPSFLKRHPSIRDAFIEKNPQLLLTENFFTIVDPFIRSFLEKQRFVTNSYPFWECEVLKLILESEWTKENISILYAAFEKTELNINQITNLPEYLTSRFDLIQLWFRKNPSQFLGSCSKDVQNSIISYYLEDLNRLFNACPLVQKALLSPRAFSGFSGISCQLIAHALENQPNFSENLLSIPELSNTKNEKLKAICFNHNPSLYKNKYNGSNLEQAAALNYIEFSDQIPISAKMQEFFINSNQLWKEIYKKYETQNFLDYGRQFFGKEVDSVNFLIKFYETIKAPGLLEKLPEQAVDAIKKDRRLLFEGCVFDLSTFQTLFQIDSGLHKQLVADIKFMTAVCNSNSQAFKVADPKIKADLLKQTYASAEKRREICVIDPSYLQFLSEEEAEKLQNDLYFILKLVNAHGESGYKYASSKIRSVALFQKNPSDFWNQATDPLKEEVIQFYLSDLRELYNSNNKIKEIFFVKPDQGQRPITPQTLAKAIKESPSLKRSNLEIALKKYFYSSLPEDFQKDLDIISACNEKQDDFFSMPN